MERFLKLLCTLGALLAGLPILAKAYQLGKFAEAYSNGFNGTVNLDYVLVDYLVIGTGLLLIAISVSVALSKLKIGNHRQLSTELNS